MMMTDALRAVIILLCKK